MIQQIFCKWHSIWHSKILLCGAYRKESTYLNSIAINSLCFQFLKDSLINSILQNLQIIRNYLEV